MRRAAAGVALAVALAGCGASGHQTTVVRTVTATSNESSSSTSASGNPAGPQDQSPSIAAEMRSSSKLQSFLQQGYPGVTIDVTNAECVESGSTQNYSCIDSYTVSGASDPTEDGSYQIGATATCDNSGNCQGLTACDQNISVNGTTSCPFADNVFNQYAIDVQQNGAGSYSVAAASPSTGQTYTDNCEMNSDTQIVDCSHGGDLIQFPEWAAAVYQTH